MEQDADDHVFLRIAWVLATQVALHHILIESVGGNHGKGTCQELLPEILLLVRIVEEEDATPFAARDILKHIHGREVQILGDVPDAEEERQ